MIQLNDIKNYLAIDFNDSDETLEIILESAQKIVADMARVETIEDIDDLEVCDTAVLYTVAYLYEHREEARHKDLILNLRYLLFGEREPMF